MKRWFLLFSIALALGCGDSTTPKSIAGTYVLVSIEGKPIPVTWVYEGDTLVTWTGGSFTLSGDRFYSHSIKGYDYYEDAEFEGVETGTYTRTGNSLTLTPNDGRDPYPAEINGRKFTRGGSTWVYEKQ